MLIRFVVKNLFSFKEFTEFNMLPGRFSRLAHHVFKAGDTDLLKLNILYGANGAGKSNLIKALALLNNFLESGKMPLAFITETFKFDKESSRKDVYLGVEFFKNGITYYYGLTIREGIIMEEELLLSGLGKKEDVVLFRRTDDDHKKKIELEFHPNVEADKEAALFPSFLKNEILKRNRPVLHYMRNRRNKVFDPFEAALEWFEKDLVLIEPSSKPSGLVLQLEKDEKFCAFANEVMRSFNTGIMEIKVETTALEDYFGMDNKQRAEQITAELKANPGRAKFMLNRHEEVLFVLEDQKAVAKRLYFLHIEDGGATKFAPWEESDGTRRLLDYIPAFYEAIHASIVYVVDEIERSIHPLLIKELIRKFSHDGRTKGQLIFSTHESNLLDQDIFRPDEIWFAQKKEGATELYPLSEFREHHTIDIRKGYLNGRYGAIPFLGNLKDLNWDKYAEADQVHL